MGPCLCGDPACGNCFPMGQVCMKCSKCAWTGKRYECGIDEVSERVIDTCPACGADAEEA